MCCVDCSRRCFPPQGNVPAKDLQRRPLEMFMCSVLKRQGYGEGRLASSPGRHPGFILQPWRIATVENLHGCDCEIKSGRWPGNEAKSRLCAVVVFIMFVGGEEGEGKGRGVSMYSVSQCSIALVHCLLIPPLHVQASAGWHNIYEDKLTDRADIMVEILSLFY